MLLREKQQGGEQLYSSSLDSLREINQSSSHYNYYDTIIIFYKTVLISSHRFTFFLVLHDTGQDVVLWFLGSGVEP